MGSNDWEAFTSFLIYALEMGSDNDKKLAKEELIRLARAMDEINEKENE